MSCLLPRCLRCRSLNRLRMRLIGSLRLTLPGWLISRPNEKHKLDITTDLWRLKFQYIALFWIFFITSLHYISSPIIYQIKTVLYDVVQITLRQQSIDQESEVVEEWRDLAFITDRLFFWISLIILIIVALWMIVMSTQHPDIERYGAVYVWDW